MGKKPRFIEIDGMLWPCFMTPEVLRASLSFKPDKEDVTVVTYPKCGTTWVSQIIALILRNGEPLMTPEEYSSFITWLEGTPMEQLIRMPKPRLLETHVPFDRLNFNPEAKYIYVARNPADCLVSYYHPLHFFPFMFFNGGTLDDCFELFIQGKLMYNDYFDHLLSGYEKRNEPNVLFLTYETMLSDHRSACLKIAQFLDKSLYKNLLENDEAILKKVLEYSSIDFMRSTVNGFLKTLMYSIPSEEDMKVNPVLKKQAEAMQEAIESNEKCEGSFIRKGAVGDGKSTLSAEQLKRLDDRIREKTANSDVMSLWEKN